MLSQFKYCAASSQVDVDHGLIVAVQRVTAELAGIVVGLERAKLARS